jgi:hypothetical protein
MVPFSWVLLAAFLVSVLVFSAIIGALAGFLAARTFRLRATAIWKNGIIGAVAFAATFFACLLIPYENSITYKLGAGGTVPSTMRHYQHPVELGCILAGLFPILYAFVRSRRSRRSSPSA